MNNAPITLSLLAGLIVAGGCQQANAEDSPWMVRARALHISPNDSSGQISTIPGSAVAGGSYTTLELDFSYFLTRNLALEAILGTSKHDIDARGSIAPLGTIAKIRTLPPVISLQYHFRPQAQVKPYVGLGFNYTKFYDEKSTASLDNALGASDVHLSSSTGLSAQFGVDIKVKDAWFVNLDAKYIRMDTKATIRSAGVERTVDVDIDPWFLGVGIGRRF